LRNTLTKSDGEPTWWNVNVDSVHETRSRDNVSALERSATLSFTPQIMGLTNPRRRGRGVGRGLVV
jgi:hypothetical protein